MKIIVRLPNWLGDMVMSAAAIKQLQQVYPQADIYLVVKQGLQDLLKFFPTVSGSFVFNKKRYPGLGGAWRFGRELKKQHRFDLFITLPNSFSSAAMALASGSAVRIGFSNEGRDLMLSRAYKKPKNIYRVEEYLHLIEVYSGEKAGAVSVRLNHSFSPSKHLVVNINSEASSRRLTPQKAVEIISSAREQFEEKILLIGGPAEKSFVDLVWGLLPSRQNMENLAGKTSLAQLAEVLASAQLVLSTDSGPAHLANALGTKTIVLFGAGNENNTSPYNKGLLEVIRLGKLSCEPCVKNVCVQFQTPQCLELLETEKIITTMQKNMA